jgi:putative FMN-dependent luciferase-like monooxygenase
VTTSKRLGFFTRVLDEAPAGERYRLAIEQIVHAERHGFSSAWVAQHHFNGAEGGLPSPLVLLSHVAAHTSSITLGTGIITLPLDHPVRVAEDAAVVDLLSGGRLQLGVGSGGTASSFAPFGKVSEQRGATYGEHLTVLRDALAGRSVSPTQTSIVYPSVPSLGQRIWQATFSVEGGRRAGLAGDGLLLSRAQPRTDENRSASLSDLQNPIVDAYLESLPTGGEPRISGARSVFVADDRDEARAITRQAIARSAFLPFVNVANDDLDSVFGAYDTHVGSAEEVISAFERDSVLDRCTDITFQVHPADPGHALTLRSIELLASEVAPALGWSRAAVAARTFAHSAS